MFLIFKRKDKEDFKVEITPKEADNIIYGNDKVKEISIIHYVTNGEDITLEEIYKEINSIDKEEIMETVAYYSENMQFSFKVSIKALYYRVQDYMREQNLEIVENLSIRFTEDNEVGINDTDNFLFCDKLKCCYLKGNDYCLKYNKELQKYKNQILVCKGCFLESWPTLGRKIYDNMVTLLSD